VADEDKPIRLSRDALRRLREARRTKVRYGRATLTVDRAVAVLGTPMGEALAAHRRGEMDPEQIAWRFLREQAVAHSQTFDWDAVNLDKLLPRVTAVMREPELKAQTPEELIAELEKVEADQQEARKRLAEQMRKYTQPLPADYLKIMQRTRADLEVLGRQQRLLQQNSELIQNAMKPMLVRQEWTRRNQRQLEQIQKALRPTMALPSFGLTQDRLREMLGLNLPQRLHELTAIKNPFLEQDWRPVFERVAEVAREADAPEVAQVVEVTASKAEEGDSRVDLDAMREAIERLTEQLEESNRLASEKADEKTATGGSAGSRGDAFSRQLLIQVALMMIRWMIEAILAVDFGLPLPPQTPDSSEPPDEIKDEPPSSLT
jgi:hypothetical protein